MPYRFSIDSETRLTLNRHFALNSVWCRYVWSSEAWLRSVATLKLVMNVVGELKTEKNSCGIVRFPCDSAAFLYESAFPKCNPAAFVGSLHTDRWSASCCWSQLNVKLKLLSSAVSRPRIFVITAEKTRCQTWLAVISILDQKRCHVSEVCSVF